MSALVLVRSVRRLSSSDWLVHRSCAVHETAINSFFSVNPTQSLLDSTKKRFLYIFVIRRFFLFSASPVPSSVHIRRCLYSSPSLSSQVLGLANICVEMLNLKSSHRFARSKCAQYLHNPTALNGCGSHYFPRLSSRLRSSSFLNLPPKNGAFRRNPIPSIARNVTLKWFIYFLTKILDENCTLSEQNSGQHKNSERSLSLSFPL